MAGFRVDDGGTLHPIAGSVRPLSAATSFPSVGAVPFGMAFNRASSQHQFIVTDAAGGPNNTGASTAYRLAHGTINLINGPVPDHQIAPCWLVITSDGRFAYTSNADSQTISGYSIHANGTISLLNANGATATTPPATFPLEEALSNDSRFLYVLDSRLLLTPPGHAPGLPDPPQWEPDLRRRFVPDRATSQRHWPGSRVGVRPILRLWSVANIAALQFVSPPLNHLIRLK